MIGNVWEWTFDWYQAHADAAHACCTPANPRGGDPEQSRDPRDAAAIPRRVMKVGRTCSPTSAAAAGRPPVWPRRRTHQPPISGSAASSAPNSTGGWMSTQAGPPGTRGAGCARIGRVAAAGDGAVLVADVAAGAGRAAPRLGYRGGRPQQRPSGHLPCPVLDDRWTHHAAVGTLAIRPRPGFRLAGAATAAVVGPGWSCFATDLRGRGPRGVRRAAGHLAVLTACCGSWRVRGRGAVGDAAGPSGTVLGTWSSGLAPCCC